jgi:hypothetical protein
VFKGCALIRSTISRQQTLAIHPNNNRGTETQQSTSDFDANGNLLNLNNIANLEWYHNNTIVGFQCHDCYLGGWREFVANHYCLLDAIDWLGYCLCRRCKFAGRVLGCS